MISAWLDRNHGARLVVIDVLARVRGPAGRDTAAYDADYRAVTQAKAVADHHGVPFVIVHHTRKASAADFLDEVSGTQGVAGAADAGARPQADARPGRRDPARHRPRRGGGRATRSTFAADIGAWQLSDIPADEVMLGDTRAAILAYVREHEGARPKEIADGTGLDYATVRQTARRMADDGQLDTDGQGRYLDVSPLSPLSLSQVRTQIAVSLPLSPLSPKGQHQGAQQCRTRSPGPSSLRCSLRPDTPAMARTRRSDR